MTPGKRNIRYVKRVGDMVLLYPYKETVFPFSLEAPEFGAHILEKMEEGKMYEATMEVTINVY